MRYIVQTNQHSSKKYATHLRLDRQGESLIWESSPGQDVLVVQMAFNCHAVDSIENICQAMDGMELPKDCFVELASMPGVWVHYVTASAYARNGGCAMRAKACTYTIFCCDVQGEECTVYLQSVDRAGNLPYRNIRLQIPVQVQKITRTEGIFKWAHEVDTGYYQILLPKEYAKDVDDGDIYYTVAGAGNMEIPITKQMFEHESIYIQTYDKPILASHNDGLKIVQ